MSDHGKWDDALEKEGLTKPDEIASFLRGRAQDPESGVRVPDECVNAISEAFQDGAVANWQDEVDPGSDSPNVVAWRHAKEDYKAAEAVLGPETSDNGWMAFLLGVVAVLENAVHHDPPLFASTSFDLTQLNITSSRTHSENAGVFLGYVFYGFALFAVFGYGDFAHEYTEVKVTLVILPLVSLLVPLVCFVSAVRPQGEGFNLCRIFSVLVLWDSSLGRKKRICKLYYDLREGSKFTVYKSLHIGGLDSVGLQVPHLYSYCKIDLEPASAGFESEGWETNRLRVGRFLLFFDKLYDVSEWGTFCVFALGLVPVGILVARGVGAHV